MNFQTSKRIMCCLMAALILCCAVVRPIEASASVVAAGVLTAVGGIDAIISGMIALGVVWQSVDLLYSYARTIIADLPEEDAFYVAGSDYPNVKAVKYGDKFYVSENFINWLRNQLYYSPTVQLPVYRVSYLGTVSVSGDPISFNERFEHLLGSDGMATTSLEQQITNNYRCYTANLTDGTSHNGFYFFGNAQPSMEWAYDVYVGYLGQTFDKILTLTLPAGAVVTAYNYLHDYWEVYYKEGDVIYFPGASGFKFASVYGRINSVAVPGEYVYADFIPKIDTDYETWTKTGIWIVITDEPETGDDNNNDEDNKQPKRFLPLRTEGIPEQQTPDEAQSGDGADESYSKPDGDVDIYDGPGDENGDTDDPAADPADYDDTNLLEQLRLFGIDLKNGFNDMVNKLLSLINVCSDILKSSNNILEAIEGLADLFIPKLITAIKATWNDFINLLWQKFSPIVNLLLEGLPAVLQKLAEWLEPLMDYLLEGLKNLFVPKTGYFDAKITELRGEFKLFDSILATLYDLKGFLLSLGSTPPVIYANLAAAGGSIYWGANTVFVDMSWYAPYKPTMDTILSGLLWLWFAWRMVLSLPGILGGMSGMWKNPTNYTKTKEE